MKIVKELFENKNVRNVIKKGRCLIATIDDERVVLVDTSFPLLTKEMTREEFNKKLKENPANDKVRTGKRVQGKQVASEIQENEEEKQADTTKYQKGEYVSNNKKHSTTRTKRISNINTSRHLARNAIFRNSTAYQTQV